MPTPEIVTGVLIKLAGAFAGSILALVFIPPKTRREFWRRGSGSLIMGMVFAPTALDWLKLTANIEGMITAACAAAFSAWWIMGLVIRVLRAYDKRV